MSHEWTEHRREWSLYRSIDSSNSRDESRSASPSPSSPDSLYALPSPPTLRHAAAVMSRYTSLRDIPPFSLDAHRTADPAPQPAQSPSPTALSPTVCQNYQHTFSPPPRGPLRVVNADIPPSPSTPGADKPGRTSMSAMVFAALAAEEPSKPALANTQHVTKPTALATTPATHIELAQGRWCSPHVADHATSSSSSPSTAPDFPPKGRVWAGDLKLASCNTCVKGWKARHLHDEAEEAFQRAVRARRAEETARQQAAEHREAMYRSDGAGIVQRDAATTWIEDVRVLGCVSVCSPTGAQSGVSRTASPSSSRRLPRRTPAQEQERLRLRQHGARALASAMQQIADEGTWENVELSEDEWVEVGREFGFVGGWGGEW